jgi:hypothetical protein
MRCWRSWPNLLAVTLAACAGGRPAQAQLGADPLELPPVGFGTLRQDQVGVRLTTGNLAVRVLPLDERVIRLLSPDAYRSLAELRASRAADIAEAAQAAGHDSVALFIVTFFALQPETRFSPDELYITSQNTFYRPVGIVPLTRRWSEYVVDQRQQAVAIYLFEPRVAVLRPFTVTYAGQSSNAWEGALRLLDAERARAMARAQQRSQPPPQ